MDLTDVLPRLRPLDIIPTRDSNDQPCIQVFDSSQISEQGLVISWAGYFVMAHMDGQHTGADVQKQFQERFGQKIPLAEIEKLVEILDRALFLYTDRFESVYAERVAAYRAADARDNRDRYPDADALRAELLGIVAGGSAAPVNGELRGLIAPHLDYGRGKPCYADVYATLSAIESPYDRYVILGTNHHGRSTGVVATRKAFQTPLGRVESDIGFVDRLEGALGADLCAHEMDHAGEHSVELQVHFLQVISGGSSFEIVPVLCPDPCGPTGLRPADGYGPDLDAFADALGRLVAEDDRRTLVIAGADLSHIGQRFGNVDKTTPELLEVVAQADRQFLDSLESRTEDDGLELIRGGGNATSICSAGCIYAALRSLPGCSCRVLRYHQAVDIPAETSVTCASAIICAD